VVQSLLWSELVDQNQPFYNHRLIQLQLLLGLCSVYSWARREPAIKNRFTMQVRVLWLATTWLCARAGTGN